MTEDELRDRIAAEITPELYWDYSPWDEADDQDKATARKAADRIITKLGLTVEERTVGEVQEVDGTVRDIYESRVVGRWEEA